WNYPNYGKVLWFIGVIAAAFTSFYMFRLLILTFYGSPRYTELEVHHVHESPKSMLMPLIVLAILSMVSGLVGVPPVLGGGNQIARFLTPEAHQTESTALGNSGTEALLMAVSAGAALTGLLLAYLFYVARPGLPGRMAAKVHAMYTILLNKYYVDELYDAVIV